ncbi:glycosyltransferase [Enterobacter hormaechei]
MKILKKVCLISINSYDELTGGGVYLRTLVKFLLKQQLTLTLIDKENSDKNFNDTHFNHLSYKKNKLSDIVSRLLFLPSFYMVYIFSLVKIFRGYDVIAFHNSRLGVIICFLKFLFPNKKILLFTDNFEYDLLKQKKKTLTSFIEKYLVKFNEALALKNADFISYITEHDKKNIDSYYRIEKANHLITPVIFDKSELQGMMSTEFAIKLQGIKTDKRRKLIFTGSFDFFPNIDSAKKILFKAHEYPEILFILAGRKINSLEFPDMSNVLLFDSLNNDEMAALLSESDVFYSPLVMGSGMKTKVAEALSHGLYIYASEHTMIGYEDIKNNDKCVTTIKDVNEPFPDFIKKSSFDKELIKSTHKKYYSCERFCGNELNSFLS